MEENKQVIEERTLEEVLLELRKSKNYTYLDITEKLNQKGTYIEEKIIKRWELGLIYPSTDELYLLSEIYKFPVVDLIQAKNNSYKKGMDSIHYRLIKWFCYFTGASIKIGIIAMYVILFLAFIFALMFFVDCANTYMTVRKSS